MSDFTLKFNMDNAAFEGEGRRDEVIRILSMVISQIQFSYGDGDVIMDVNGNKVGEWSGDMDPEPEEEG